MVKKKLILFYFCIFIILKLIAADNVYYDIERPNSKKNVAIFIHGFTGDYLKTWGDFPILLHEDEDLIDFDFIYWGYPSKFFSTKPEISTIGENLKTFIRYNCSKYENIILIGHSMGGLVLRDYVIELLKQSSSLYNNKEADDELKKIKLLIQFGTPNDGLSIAAFSFFNQQIANMNIAGKYISSLRNDFYTLIYKNSRIPCIVIAGVDDNFIPKQSVKSIFPDLLVTSGNHLTMVKPDSVNHLSFTIVKKELKKFVPEIIVTPEQDDFVKRTKNIVNIDNLKNTFWMQVTYEDNFNGSRSQTSFDAFYLDENLKVGYVVFKKGSDTPATIAFGHTKTVLSLNDEDIIGLDYKRNLKYSVEFNTLIITDEKNQKYAEYYMEKKHDTSHPFYTNYYEGKTRYLHSTPPQISNIYLYSEVNLYIEKPDTVINNKTKNLINIEKLKKSCWLEISSNDKSTSTSYNAFYLDENLKVGYIIFNDVTTAVKLASDSLYSYSRQTLNIMDEDIISLDYKKNLKYSLNNNILIISDEENQIYAKYYMEKKQYTKSLPNKLFFEGTSTGSDGYSRNSKIYLYTEINLYE